MDNGQREADMWEREKKSVKYGVRVEDGWPVTDGGYSYADCVVTKSAAARKSTALPLFLYVGACRKRGKLHGRPGKRHQA